MLTILEERLLQYQELGLNNFEELENIIAE